MRLTSSAFGDHEMIPIRYTCDGSDISPPLAWSGTPTETRSFAVVCVDPDAPAGDWYHWAVYDIPADIAHLEEHYLADGVLSSQGRNDFRKKGYAGPCPPHGHGMHHYHFQLFALDVDRLPVAGSAHCREIETSARSHAIARAELTGLYAR
jgi:hypothetical protein